MTQKNPFSIKTKQNKKPKIKKGKKRKGRKKGRWNKEGKQRITEFNCMEKVIT